MIIYLITRNFFLTFAAKSDLAGGFIKFFILATIGDFVGTRLREKQWKIPKNILLKAVVWGLIGIVIVLTFGIYYNGVIYLQKNNILPFYESTLALAFFTSLLMNISFAPTMMTFHRMTDTYLNLKYDKNFYHLSLRGIDLSGLDLQMLNFSFIDLSYVNFENTNLKGADLSYSNLSYTNLKEANLKGADVSHSNLNYAFAMYYLSCIMRRPIFTIKIIK